jgi:hypothetical protein
MKKLNQQRVILAAGMTLTFGFAPASANDTVSRPEKPRQIMVVVYAAKGGLRFELESGIYKNHEYKKFDANYFLADLKMREGGDCQIIEIVDDRAPLSAITEVSEMAINAGFKDIRPFVLWHKTGRMAQVEFGPPIKFAKSADKIEHQTEKTQ